MFEQETHSETLEGVFPTPLDICLGGIDIKRSSTLGPEHWVDHHIHSEVLPKSFSALVSSAFLTRLGFGVHLVLVPSIHIKTTHNSNFQNDLGKMGTFLQVTNVAKTQITSDRVTVAYSNYLLAFQVTLEWLANPISNRQTPVGCPRPDRCRCREAVCQGKHLARDLVNHLLLGCLEGGYFFRSVFFLEQISRDQERITMKNHSPSAAVRIKKTYGLQHAIFTTPSRPLDPSKKLLGAPGIATNAAIGREPSKGRNWPSYERNKKQTFTDFTAVGGVWQNGQSPRLPGSPALPAHHPQIRIELRPRREVEGLHAAKVRGEEEQPPTERSTGRSTGVKHTKGSRQPATQHGLFFHQFLDFGEVSNLLTLDVGWPRISESAHFMGKRGKI